LTEESAVVQTAEPPAAEEEPVAVPGSVGGQPAPDLAEPAETAGPEPPAPRTQSISMAQMYDTWVELDETIGTAQTELRALLASRKNAEAMRRKAQDVLDQADAAWEEAGRLGDAAWTAFGRGFTASLPGVASRLRMIKEVDEARKAQAQLRLAGNTEAWEEADRTRQKATAELLKALTAVAAAAAQVDRELRETGNLPAAAGSLRNSALEDLRCAQAIGEELALLGREALEQLAAGQMPGEGRPTPESIAGQFETRQVSAHPSQVTPRVSEAKDVAAGGVVNEPPPHGERRGRRKPPEVSRRPRRPEATAAGLRAPRYGSKSRRRLWNPLPRRR